MFQAVAAARRSAELGRQVGAAVCTSEGDVIAVGVNEVPKSGGGLYWEGDPDDAREVTRGSDTNRKQRRQIAEDIARRLIADELLSEDVSVDKVLYDIEASALGDIIEFVRAVHAEMAALMDAVRRGVRVDEGTLYATTFPCHHCARHIVAAPDPAAPSSFRMMTPRSALSRPARSRQPGTPRSLTPSPRS
jgi:deoxycytidylate deaminase